MPQGRPSSFTQDLADRICWRLASEGESLREICQSDGMPAAGTVFRWLQEDAAFREQYIRARDQQADLYADMVKDEAFSASDASLGRLRMDALKWTASKLAPSRYGEKITNEHTGPGGGPVQVQRVERVIVDSKGDDE